MKLEASADVIRKLHPLEFYKRFLPEGIRPDGRNLNKPRVTVISAGSLTTAEGSALVKLGSTSAICGIKAEVTIPADTEPQCGKLVLSVELPPLCSPNIQRWTDSVEQNSSLEVQIEDILLKTNVLNLEALCIKDSSAVWVLYVDVYILEHDGNCFDAALLSVLTALTNVKLPEVEVNEEQIVSIVEGGSTQSLELNHYPIPLSFCILDDKLLVDPTSEEEELSSTCFTIVYNNRGELCSLYKPGGKHINDDILEECKQTTLNRTEHIVKLMKQANEAKK
ncbi:exosome complex protein RRP43 [Acrasis kona]|uniref:Ribosomal RNA-processing protein 43 n=1 Tax=Acrasis kona TaxID=1008807 RepID=A0AAW2ZN08_9EUKA